VFENTIAIVFLGTPHRGADLASILDATLNITGSGKQFVDDIKTGSQCLEGINDYFPRLTGQIELMSFWESEAMRGLGVTS
jgi:hypothetical protein